MGVDQSDAEQTNSDLITSWMADTREILGRVIHGVEDAEEYDIFCRAEGRLIEALEDAALGLVITIEAVRQDPSLEAQRRARQTAERVAAIAS